MGLSSRWLEIQDIRRIKDIDMGVIVIDSMIECIGIDDITKEERVARKNRQDHEHKFSVLNGAYF